MKKIITWIGCLVFTTSFTQAQETTIRNNQHHPQTNSKGILKGVSRAKDEL